MKKTQLLHTILIENDIQVHVIVSKKKIIARSFIENGK